MFKRLCEEFCRIGCSTIGKDRYRCSNHRDKLGCGNTKTVSRIVLQRRIDALTPDALLSINSTEDIQTNVVSGCAIRLLSATMGWTADCQLSARQD